jgi:hypothetical protein
LNVLLRQLTLISAEMSMSANISTVSSPSVL